MRRDDDLTPQSAHAAALAEPCSWGEVLDAYVTEQAAQSEYEALVCSLVATRESLDWDVMNVLLMRRKVTHETFVRTYRLWEHTKARRNGYGNLGHLGQADQLQASAGTGRQSATAARGVVDARAPAGEGQATT